MVMIGDRFARAASSQTPNVPTNESTVKLAASRTRAVPSRYSRARSHPAIGLPTAISATSGPASPSVTVPTAAPTAMR